MLYKYFGQCEDIAAARKLYKNLAVKNHPDHGGSTEIMQEINAEFDEFCATHKDGKTGVASKFRDIVMNCLNLGDVDVEIIGTWLWLHGKTYENREKIRSYGFKWSKGKKAWYWFDGVNKQEFRPRRSEDWMKTRLKYGSEFIKGKSKETVTPLFLGC